MAVTISTIDKSYSPHMGVIRVPGGWIYRRWDIEKQDYVSDVFVPFNNEYQPIT